MYTTASPPLHSRIHHGAHWTRTPTSPRDTDTDKPPPRAICRVRAHTAISSTGFVLSAVKRLGGHESFRWQASRANPPGLSHSWRSGVMHHAESNGPGCIDRAGMPNDDGDARRAPRPDVLIPRARGPNVEPQCPAHRCTYIHTCALLIYPMIAAVGGVGCFRVSTSTGAFLDVALRISDPGGCAFLFVRHGLCVVDGRGLKGSGTLRAENSRARVADVSTDARDPRRVGFIGADSESRHLAFSTCVIVKWRSGS